MQKRVEGRLKKEGTYVYLWLIHVDVWQKPLQYRNYPPIKKKQQQMTLTLKHYLNLMLSAAHFLLLSSWIFFLNQPLKLWRSHYSFISKKCLNLSAMFILKYKFESWHHHFSLIKCEFLIFSSRLRNNCEISFFPLVSSPLLSNKKAINCNL